MTFEVVIVDTGTDYRVLEREMQMVSRSMTLVIDSSGGTYDPLRDSIIVPLDSDDELYRGYYSPRRFPETALSMEYLDTYMTAPPGTFAIIASISEDPISIGLLVDRTTADNLSRVQGPYGTVHGLHTLRQIASEQPHNGDHFT